MKNNTIKYIMGLMVVASNSVLAGPGFTVPSTFGIEHGLSLETNEVLVAVGTNLQDTGAALDRTGNSIAAAANSLYETGVIVERTAAQTVSSTNDILTKQVASIGGIANQVSKNIDGSLQNFSINLASSLPHLIKTAAVSCAGLACCGAGAWMFAQGIRQACTAQSQENKDGATRDTNKTFFGRCAKILAHPLTKGVIQSTLGLATFVAGIMTITKSDKIVTYFNR